MKRPEWKSLQSRTERRYQTFFRHIDVDAFEEAIGFEPLREGSNKLGEPEDIGHCPDPWHLHKNGDTTGKFAINRERRLYNCFVCNGGTLLDLAMAVKGLEEQEAEEWLFQFTAPVEVSNTDFLSEIDAILYEEERAKVPMPYYNEHMLSRWTNGLSDLAPWLTERGISEEVAVSHRVGFEANAMRIAPIQLDKPREEPYRGPCVYLPHFWAARLVGWQQRWLDDERPKWIPKYTNTSGFPKAETIYNYENVYLADKPIIVVESVPTALFLVSLGYPAVATFGSSVTEEQMRLLRLFQQGIVLAPDNDKPGRKWIGYSEDEIDAQRKGKRIDRVVMGDYLARYVQVKVIEPIGKPGDDLGDLIDEGYKFARQAVAILYSEAQYY